MTRRYVLGFAFDPSLSRVILIRKVKPPWQAGRVNGIGGHIEEDELSCEAMGREFSEETGIEADLSWAQYAQLSGSGKEDWLIDIYRSVSASLPQEDRHMGELKWSFTTSEGTAEIVQVSDLKNQPVLPNLLYLIPMAINHIQGTDKCRFFSIMEGS